MQEKGPDKSACSHYHSLNYFMPPVHMGACRLECPHSDGSPTVSDSEYTCVTVGEAILEESLRVYRLEES